MDEELRGLYGPEEVRARTPPQELRQMGMLQGAPREPSTRELLESQLRGAIQEVADLRLILAMLPTEPTPQQDAALRRLLTGGRK